MKTALNDVELRAGGVHGTMRYILFRDARDNRTLDSLKISKDNVVVKDFAIGSVWELPDRLKQDMSCLKELDFDAVIVDPEETNIYVENVLYNLRRLKVNKPVYIARSGKRHLPVMAQMTGGALR